MTTSNSALRATLTLVVIGMLTQGCDDAPTPAPRPMPIPQSDMTSVPPDMQGDMDQADMMDMPTQDMLADSSVDMIVDMPEDMGCEPESTLQFCTRYTYSCGELVAEDRCGTMRTEICGETCSLPQTCVEEVNQSNQIQGASCTCNVENVIEVCNEVGKLCGPLAAPCQGMVCDTFCVDNVSTGGEYSCALGSNTIRCWGANTSGQLGLGTTMTEKNPAALDLELKATSVETSDSHSCAILDDTSLICWGLNTYGQLGILTTVNQTFPDLVDVNSRAFKRGVHKVVLGHHHTCALVDDDFDPASDPAPQAPFSAYCWGSNAQGAIGNIDRVILGADSGAPVLVTGLQDNVIDMDAGYGHNCAIVAPTSNPAERQVRCWGLDEGGQLGARDIRSSATYMLTNSGTREQMTVQDPMFPDDPSRTIKVDVPTGHYHHYMYNEPENNRLAVLVSPATVRADRPDGAVTSTAFTNTSTPFVGEFEEIVAGETISCVRRADMSMACWGVLPFDHDRSTCKVPTPSKATGLDVKECSAWPPSAQWQSSTIVMLDKFSERDQAYGLPQAGVRFRAIAPRPVEITHHPTDPTVHPSYLSGGEPVRATQMSAHGDHVCVLLDDSQYLPPTGSAPSFTNVHCFGNNDTGQLGDSTNSPIGYPIKLSTDVDGEIVRALQVGVGNAHSCAVADNNNIKCWGSNKNSQLGNENLQDDESFRPFDVLLR